MFMSIVNVSTRVNVSSEAVAKEADGLRTQLEQAEAEASAARVEWSKEAEELWSRLSYKKRAYVASITRAVVAVQLLGRGQKLGNFVVVGEGTTSWTRGNERRSPWMRYDAGD
jgi:hypothetical protein